MSFFVTFSYVYECELKYERVRVDFHSTPIPDAIEFPEYCSRPEQIGVVLCFNDESGEYDAEVMTLEDILEKDVQYDHFLTWRLIHDLYADYQRELQGLPKAKRCKF